MSFTCSRRYFAMLKLDRIEGASFKLFYSIFTELIPPIGALLLSRDTAF
jgi:hypothetical protein